MRNRLQFAILTLAAVGLLTGCGEDRAGTGLLEPTGLAGTASETMGMYNVDKVDITKVAVGNSCAFVSPKDKAQEKAEEKALEKIKEEYIKQVADEIRSTHYRHYSSTKGSFGMTFNNPEDYTDEELVEVWGEALADHLEATYVGIGADTYTVTVLNTWCDGCGWSVKVKVEGAGGIRVQTFQSLTP